jgi:hypothetical protein
MAARLMCALSGQLNQTDRLDNESPFPPGWQTGMSRRGKDFDWVLFSAQR